MLIFPTSNRITRQVLSTLSGDLLGGLPRPMREPPPPAARGRTSAPSCATTHSRMSTRALREPRKGTARMRAKMVILARGILRTSSAPLPPTSADLRDHSLQGGSPRTRGQSRGEHSHGSTERREPRFSVVTAAPLAQREGRSSREGVRGDAGSNPTAAFCDSSHV